MKKPALSLLLFIALNNVSAVQAKEEVTASQLQQIQTLQRRADNLAFGETGPDDYHLAKARTWLDLALSEYYDKDDSGIVSAAIVQAGNIVDALEKKQTGMTMDTPQKVQGSETVRPDLWDRIAALKKRGQFSCGQRPAAEAEVYLVWGGHEYAEEGQSHAESYLRTAENLVYESQVAIDNCAAAPAAAQAMAPPPLEKITLSGDALFAFDRATLNPDALWRLDNLADNIKSVTRLEQVLLVGHTDRLRSDGNEKRNISLSIQRAESIKQYLVGKGIAADKIRATGAGSTKPLVQCSTKQSKEKQIECLQPNRRVEIILQGTKEKGAAPPAGDPQHPG